MTSPAIHRQESGIHSAVDSQPKDSTDIEAVLVGHVAEESLDTPCQPVRGSVRRRGWRRLSHGLYVPESGSVLAGDLPRRGMGESYPRPARSSPRPIDLRAWAMVLPDGAAFTHVTAAVRGWWLPPLPDGVPVFVAVAEPGWRPRRRGLHVTRHTAPIAAGLIDGHAVADPAETLLAAARHLDLLSLVILGDSALHLGDVTLDQLMSTGQLRRRGAPALRAALPIMDGRSESPGETLLRLLHRSCAVPVEPQFRVEGAYGNTVARADLRIEATRQLAEFDGAHHRSARQYEQDRARDRRLRQLGWSLYSYPMTSVVHQPQVVLHDADHALGGPALPGRLTSWLGLLQQSTYTGAGMKRLRSRLGLVQPPMD